MYRLKHVKYHVITFFFRNKWKFNLKDGIMNLNGKDYVFSRHVYVYVYHKYIAYNI